MFNQSASGWMLAMSAVLASGAVSVQAAEPISASQKRSIDELFSAYRVSGSPGCALGIIRDHQLWYTQGYGLASIEHNLPVVAETTVFDIGSTSKQFMAASILLLEQDGRLKLTDDIRKYLPEFPDYGATITLDHLLNHSSGIRDYINLMLLAGVHEEDYTTEAQALQMLVRQKALDFSPGSEHRYSNSGYFLLSIILKRVTGQSWADFAKERLFKPLGMHDTRILDSHYTGVRNKASSYIPMGVVDGARQFGLLTSHWEQTGDGGVQTTVVDLAKWDENFYQPRVGGASLVDRLLEPGTLNNGETLGYARGLMLSGEGRERSVRHGGSWAGYRAELLRLPEQAFSVAVLCNVGNSDPSRLADAVRDAVLGPGTRKEKPATETLLHVNVKPVAKPERYTGLYWDTKGARLRELLVRDGKLMYSRGPGNDEEVAQWDSQTLIMPKQAASVRIRFDKPEQPGQMFVESDGETSVFKRVLPAQHDGGAARELAGKWYSEELGVEWQLTQSEDKVSLLRPTGERLEWTPRFLDGYTMPGALVRVDRTQDGRAKGLLVDVGRAQGIYFARVQ